MPKALPLKMSLKNTVNLKNASFVVIMLLHEGLTHIQSQIKPRLHFGKSFALTRTPKVGENILQALSMVSFNKSKAPSKFRGNKKKTTLELLFEE